MSIQKAPTKETVSLPDPTVGEGMSVSQALAARRSATAYSPLGLSPEEISQLCWAAQGLTQKRKGLRTSPSARSLFPITVYLVDEEGVLEYRPKSHSLGRIGVGDVRRELAHAAIDQACLERASVIMILAMNQKRMKLEFGPWAERLCLLEAGAIAENVLIEATAIGLAGIPIGAFHPQAVREILGISGRQDPVLMIPLGHPES